MKKFSIILFSFLIFSAFPVISHAYEIPESETENVSPWSIFRPSEVLEYIAGQASDSSEASKSAQEGLQKARGIWETIKDVYGLFRELFLMTINFLAGTARIVIRLIGIFRG